MIYIIIGIIGFCYMFYLFHHDGCCGIIFCIVIGLLTAVLSMFICGVPINYIITATTDYHYETNVVRDIDAIQDRYYAISRYSTRSNNSVYNYIYKDSSENCLKTGYIDAEPKDINIYTINDTNEQPKVIKKNAVFDNHFISFWFGVPLKECKYEIYIPKDGIKYEYNIDLK